VAELLGVNESTATWLADGSAPTISDVARSLEDSAAQETP
jgi:hypothetical protein